MLRTCRSWTMGQGCPGLALQSSQSVFRCQLSVRGHLSCQGSGSACVNHSTDSWRHRLSGLWLGVRIARGLLYVVDGFQAQRRRSFLCRKCFSGTCWISPLLPLLLHSDLFAAACPVVQHWFFHQGQLAYCKQHLGQRGDDSVLCGSGSRRWAEFSVTSMLFLCREPEL